VTPNHRRLDENGVSRLLLAAGDYDMTARHMATQALRLQRHGVAGKFLSLGKVGHWFPTDFSDHLLEAVHWLEETN
jgi:acetyl esterase/lipase